MNLWAAWRDRAGPLPMTARLLSEAMKRVETWPEEVQEELISPASRSK